MNESLSIRELCLYKKMLEKDEKIKNLEDMLAHHKLRYDNDVRQIEHLEQELLDREECIYKLNKQCLNHQLERQNNERLSNDLLLQETIDFQQKKLEACQLELIEKDMKIKDLETVILFRELKKTA